MSLKIQPSEKASKFFSGKMAEAVKVIVRCRPLNQREKKLNCTTIVDMLEDIGKCSIKKPGSEQNPKEFTFDGAYYVDSTTEQIYNDIAYPLVEGVVEGYNGTVFAYGQTGCGKSFSMQGVDDPPTQRGVIPRAFQHIFESIEIAENTKYLVHASYLEIYNEDVRDLLSKNIKDKLELKEHPDRGVYVKDLYMQRVSNVGECERVMATGWQNRTVGSTLMNADSSRSHSIFTIYLEACDMGIDGGDHIRAGKLNLVDLAGSERQSKTGATGDRLKEATKINLSLSALGNVISALVDGKSKHIPYRDSKLTRLLQDSLGGNTKTLMVACLSPADNNYDETLSTLRYANRAKNIKNKPHINEDPKDALLREYQEEIKKLRGLLAGQLGPDGIKAMFGDKMASDPTFTSALLEGQSPSQRSRSDTQTEPDEERQTLDDEESEQMKREYEDKINELKQRYEAEQMSNAKLQEDMNKLKTQYDQHISQAGLAVQGNLTMERLNHEVLAAASPSSTSDVGFYESSFESAEVGSEAALMSSQQQQQQLQLQLQDEQHQVAQYIGSKPASGVSGPGEKPSFNAVLDEDEKYNEDDVMMQHEEALRRLQMLQQNMVGGERSRDEEAKKRKQVRRKHVDERKRRLAEAHVRDDDETILDVYDSIQDEMKARDRLLGRKDKKLEGLKMEIEDLNYEFERDRTEYLATIRRQERELELLNSIVSKVQPTIRRDCNYSNLDRIRSETRYDEDQQRWILPDLQIIKTSLPSPGPQNGVRGQYIDRSNSVGYSPPQSSSSIESYSQRSDEDKYYARLNRSSNEQLASSYFMPKRHVKQIISSTHSEPQVRGRYHTNSPSSPLTSSANGYPQNGGERGSSNGATLNHHHPFSTGALGNGGAYPGVDDLVRRPHKLEAISPLSAKTSKKKKKKGLEPL